MKPKKTVIQAPLHARTVFFAEDFSRVIVTRLNTEEVCFETHQGETKIVKFAIFTLVEAKLTAAALVEMADEELLK